MAARRLQYLVYITVGSCFLFLIVCSVSLATNKWFSAKLTNEQTAGLNVTVSYGLFSGKKSRTITGGYSLKLVCQGAKHCMYSCGNTTDKRKRDLSDLVGGIIDLEFDSYCTDENAKSSSKSGNVSRVVRAGEVADRVFVDFGLLVATIAFIALGMIFALVSGGLALYNTYRTPIQPILSISGLFVWNATAAVAIFLAMIMWTMEFFMKLRKSAGVWEGITGKYPSGNRSLGVSFWILIVPLLCAIANIAILKYRSWRIVQIDQNNVRVMNTNVESGETILF